MKIYRGPVLAVLLLFFLVSGALAGESKAVENIEDMSKRLITSMNANINGKIKVAVTDFDNVHAKAQQLNIGHTVSEILTSSFSKAENITVTEKNRLKK